MLIESVLKKLKDILKNVDLFLKSCSIQRVKTRFFSLFS
jgi:hypothetical protein